MPKCVGSRELKTRLGKYLRAVRGGATLVVTDRGEAIAELRPIAPDSGDVDARLDALAALGVVTRGSGEALPAFRAIRVRGEPVGETLVRDREDRS